MGKFWQGVLFEAVLRFQKRELWGKILFINVYDDEFAQVLGIFENYILVASYYPSTNEIKGIFNENNSFDVGTFSFEIHDKIYHNFHYDFKVEGEKEIVINIMFKSWTIDYEQIQNFIEKNFPCIGAKDTV